MADRGYGKMYRNPAPRIGGCYPLTRQDFEILLEGNALEAERNNRNLFIGISASGAFGALGSLTAHWETLSTKTMNPVELIFLLLLTSGTIATACLAIYHHRRTQRHSNGTAYNHLIQEIEASLLGESSDAKPDLEVPGGGADLDYFSRRGTETT